MTTDPWDDLKQTVCATIDRHRDWIIGIGEAIWAHPETGFREVETARRVQAAFDTMNVACQSGLALTGVRAELQGAQPGPTLALLGEMDGLVLPGHPAADPRTGAVHACGHHAQVAGLIGAAMALREPEILRQLTGTVVLMAVPAEEYIELEYRRRLVQDGKIGFLGGKQELIRLGCFDEVDLAMMIHTGAGRKAGTRCTMNGFTAQSARFQGRAAHAGSRPHTGINALDAANLALQAIHAQRATFRDADTVRVHSIVSAGGTSVSIVPDDVRIETMVRAKNLAAVEDAAGKARRCYHAGALALGGNVTVESYAGYLPLTDCRALGDIFERNAARFVGVDQVERADHLTSSTDMGDVTQIMPASHPGLGGAEGAGHTVDYRIVDPELAYVTPAKVLAMCAIDLLGRDAAEARDIIARHPPAIARADYPSVLRKQFECQTHTHMA